MTKNNQQKDTGGSAPRSQGRTHAEWLSLIISLLLVSGVVGVLITLWAQDQNRPASFRVEKGTVRKVGMRFYLPFTITNEGDVTGAQVTVEGSLKRDSVAAGADEQTATTTFDFIPAKGSADGIFVFSVKPADVDVRVVSFQPP